MRATNTLPLQIQKRRKLHLIEDMEGIAKKGAFSYITENLEFFSEKSIKSYQAIEQCRLNEEIKVFSDTSKNTLRAKKKVFPEKSMKLFFLRR